MSHEETPIAGDLAFALHETLTSEGWRKVIAPHLAGRLAQWRVELENGKTLTLEQVRALQAQIAFLRPYVERPQEVLEP